MTLRPRRGWIVLACVVAAIVAGCGGSTPPRTPLNKMFSYNATAKTAVLTLIPGATNMFNGYNYDGYGRGSVLIDVPLGWRITVRCINTVAKVPHTCAIARDGGNATAPVFPGATTPDPQRGLPSGHSAEFSFVASRLGAYRITCLIPEHETRGMWDAFAISRSPHPSIREIRFYGGR